MAQLVLGAVGAVIGGIYGGPTGAQLGWAIGSAVGSIIDPPKGPTVEGPKLSDLKTQTADYGVVLPVTYGTVRLAGNVLWSDDIKETKIKKKEGGKGGPTQTTITYVYTVSFAVGLCEGVIEGIRRIWANGELIYSATESSNAGTLSESGKTQGRFRVYTGTEDQLPDPTIQAKRGVGNTPTYRGVAYIVFTDLDLEKFGRRQPQLEFEVVKSGATVGYRELYNEFIPDIMPIDQWNQNILDVSGFSGTPGPFGPRFVSSNGSFFRLSSPIQLQNGTLGNEISVRPGRVWDINYGTESGTPLQVIESIQGWEDMPGPVQLLSKTVEGVVYDMASIGNMGMGASSPTYVDLFIPRVSRADLTLDMKLSTRGRLMWGGTYKPGVAEPDFYVHGTSDIANLFQAPAYANRYYMGASCSSDGNRLIIFSGPNPYSTNQDVPRLADQFHILEIVNSVPALVRSGTIDQPRDVTYELGGWGLPKGLGTPWVSNYQTTQGVLDTDGETFWVTRAVGGGSGSNVQFVRYLIEDNVLTLQNYATYERGPDGQTHSSSDMQSIWAVDGVCAVFSHQLFEDASPWFHDFGFAATRNPYLTKSAVPLSSIVADQMERVGFTSAQYDVSQLVNDMVDGFFLANRPSVRTAIETLTGPYFFECVESGEVLKFVKRGQRPTLLLDAEQMGASDGDPIDRPDPLTVTRQQELSQPLEVSCQYQDRDADYRVGVQYARRQLTNAVNQTTIQLPLVLGGDKAKQVVDAILFNLWTEREKFEFKTDRRYINLEPTDVVYLRSLSGNVWAARLTSRKEGGDGTIDWEALAEDVSVYDPESAGIVVPPTTGEQVKNTRVPTYQLAFNAPPLNGSIDEPGWFIASTGYTEGWAGSISMRSLDNGVTYTNLESSVVDRSEDSSMGFCQGVLGDWTGGNILDTVNSLVVQVVGLGELAAVTYQQILNGANTFWIGGEIVQAQQVEMLTAKSYRLSKLRRGRLGTERFMGTHVANERWALLNTTDTQFVPESLGNTGASQLVRGVTLGTEDPSTVPATTFVFDASTVMPLAPVQAYGVEQPDGTIFFKWVRRARLEAEWLDFVDVPLDEPTEAYELEFATDSNFTTVVRTEALAAPTLEYTAAMRALDTGSTTGAVWVRVYQMSSRVGRGYLTNFQIV